MGTANYKHPGQQPAEALNKICGDAYRAVKIPEAWKFMRYERIPLNDLTDPDGEIQSIAAVFADKSTKGLNLKHYRLIFHAYSEKLSLCEVTFDEIGKPQYSCVQMNKTPEGINTYLEN